MTLKGISRWNYERDMNIMSYQGEHKRKKLKQGLVEGKEAIPKWERK
jgi:hypothetical protein